VVGLVHRFVEEGIQVREVVLPFVVVVVARLMDIPARRIA
jgi:hypothetical protein